MAEAAGDRTEAATPQRLQRAREEGNVPISRELSGLAGLAAGVLALWTMSSWTGSSLARVLRNLIEESGRIDLSDGGVGAVLRDLASPVAMFALPVMGAATVGVVAMTFLQSGLALNLRGLMPDLARISPSRGLARLMSATNLVETGKSMVKLTAFCLVIRQILIANLHPLAFSALWSAGLIARRLIHLSLTAILTLLAVQAVVAGADVAWVRFHRLRQLRMTRQEMKDEFKENDGNPQVKARLRGLRRARARQRMMQAVPTATVVLTNPTHFAVALFYDRSSKSAPTVVAKGADEVAARIRELARAHRVPIVSNPPLARTLFKVPLDQEVPREQFQAVAAIIAYIWRLNQRQEPAIT